MNAPTVDPHLRIEDIPGVLQAAWLHQLRRFYDLYNWSYLNSRLRRPLFRLGLSSETLGLWDGSVRTITISFRHILSHPWERVLETLRHEMAHQYVDDVLGRRGETSHGAGFREAAHLLRVPAAGTTADGTTAAGSLGALEGSTAERDKILSRVKLLLALAKSPNEHEAASAMRMANRYLLEYNLDLTRGEAPLRYATRHLGRSSGRIQEYEYCLGHILEDHFFVRVIWTVSYDAILDRTGRVMQISGTPENLEMAEYVYHYVLNVAERLWEARRKAPGFSGGTRLQYLAGLVRGLQEKLEAQKVELREESGLVWLGDKDLSSYYRYVNPRVTKTTTGGVSRGERYHEGVRDGREITIHKGLGEDRARRGRILPGS